MGNVEVVRDEAGQSMAVEISSWWELATNCDVRAAASMLVTFGSQAPRPSANLLLRRG